MQKNTVELGCGLIGIGRVWGFKESAVPSEEQALAFLDAAFAQSIRYFDTAPSYGLSESRLGKWVSGLKPEQRNEITIATKFGEHWSDDDQKPFVDHTFAGLKKSLDQSLARIGKIDILQLHKTNPTVLKSDDLKRAWEYAQEKGITQLGVSISDLESGKIVVDDDKYQVIQLPFNQQNTAFEPIIKAATQSGKQIVTNRPFNMGETVNKDQTKSREALEQEAFEFILAQCFNGLILTGTKSPEHLRENLQAFNEATSSII